METIGNVLGFLLPIVSIHFHNCFADWKSLEPVSAGTVCITTSSFCISHVIFLALACCAQSTENLCESCLGDFKLFATRPKEKVLVGKWSPPPVTTIQALPALSVQLKSFVSIKYQVGKFPRQKFRPFRFWQTQISIAIR
jgi:hypothetical protein